uniref:CFA47 protein n=1 Tax=Latimeria chalumnae TaxID=7897 RepID=H3AJZ3_LATCH
VRICPPFVTFIGARAGKTYRATVTVKNISFNSKRLWIEGPTSEKHCIHVYTQEHFEHVNMAPCIFHKKAKSPVHFLLFSSEACDRVIQFSLCFKLSPSCYLEIEPEVDFGTVVANSTVVSKEISIINHGTALGKGAFKLEYTGSLLITIEPSSGIIETKTVQLVKVNLCTNKARVINEVAKVKLQGQDNTVLRIKANVVEQVLELLDLSDQKLECLHFGSTYFGTSKLQYGVLYNNSPEPINWVAVLVDDAIGNEVGTDLQNSTDVTLLDAKFRNKGRNTDVLNLVFCEPNQGVLQAYQKTTITFSFSPKLCREVLSYPVSPPPPPKRQDYALFMVFEIVGSKDGFLQESDHGNQPKKGKRQCVELALTGTGLPVALTVTPGLHFNFGECFVDECIDILCTLRNESQHLPVDYFFPNVAHFNIIPAKGKINPGCTKDAIFSFAPHHIGTLKVKQVMHLIGPVFSEDSCVALEMNSFHQMNLTFTGVCKATTKKMEPKILPGITPTISNETGLFPYMVSREMRRYSSSSGMALLSAAKTRIHSHRRSNSLEKNVFVAFPNDRSTSLKPGDKYEKFETIFTKVERYNYVDPDFAYTDDEEALRNAHKEYYNKYIRNRRECRLQKQEARKFKEVDNPVDIGIKPAEGLIPSRIVLPNTEHEEQNGEMDSSQKGQLLAACELAARQNRSTNRLAGEGLNAEPSTSQEKEDCSLTLTPQQLHQVVIEIKGPSTIDFGEVCAHSTSTIPLNIINNLEVHIWVQVGIECEELQQTSPLSHVVPPMSKACLPLIFESSSLGIFQKSLNYTINKKHTGSVLVLAEVVPVALELSHRELILRPMFSFLAESGFRATVKLYNPRNYPAEFSWKPIITEKGIAFSIRPAGVGVVDPYKDLECEVVWHPSFFSPEEGEFDLCVHQGNTIRLKCIA